MKVLQFGMEEKLANPYFYESREDFDSKGDALEERIKKDYPHISKVTRGKIKETKEEKGDSKSVISMDKTNQEIDLKDLLNCITCSVSSFENLDKYLEHMTSKDHVDITKLTYEKNKAILQILRQNSKLASFREVNVNGRHMRIVNTIEELKDRNKFSTHKRKELKFYCYECDCPISVDRKRHRMTQEHQLVVSFLKSGCVMNNCENFIHNPEDLIEREKHCNSVDHQLDNLQQSRLWDEVSSLKVDRKQKVKDGGLPSEVIEALCESFDEVLKDVDVKSLGSLKKKESPESQIYSKKLPNYNPNTNFGVHQLKSTIVWFCDVCQVNLYPIESNLKSHIESGAHKSALAKQKLLSQPIDETLKKEFSFINFDEEDSNENNNSDISDNEFEKIE